MLASSVEGSDVAPLAEGLFRDLGLLGQSPAAVQLRDRITRAAQVGLPVLIDGEPGAGAELVARAIHQLSTRRLGPYVSMDLSATPDDMAARELFGAEEKPSTAREDLGRLSAAFGGTLFLDEVHAMPRDVQVRFGELISRDIPVDEERDAGLVRLIAASTIDLNRLVKTDGFRTELFFRLRVLRVHVPSLRERPEDIPELASWLAARESESPIMEAARLLPEATALLSRLPWRENLRELRRVIRAALVFCENGVITAQDVEAACRATASAEVDWEIALANQARTLLGTGEVHHQLMEKARRILLGQAMTHAGDNKSRAAALLGMHRNVLSQRLVALGLVQESAANES